jgi:hypothetical protein
MPADAGSNDSEDMTMPFGLTRAKEVGERRGHAVFADENRNHQTSNFQ